ncbi:MAG: thermonuclease family protein [bacterium]|nr:thermonuclease family protein [bacterium]
MASLLTKRQKRRLLSVALSLLLALFLWVAGKQGWLRSTADTVQQAQPGQYKVLTFEDGDTITVDMNGMSERVRFIGVDTPETQDPRFPVQCFGRVASEFTKSLIGEDSVRLEADPTNPNRDRYDRLLRYVYLPDGRLANAEIIKQGYGFAYTLFPFEKLEEFRGYERQAREQSLGLWSTCDIKEENDKRTTNPS